VDTATLLREIEIAFPPVPKPSPDSITFHGEGCGQCQFLREELEKYTEPTLPDEAIKYLFNELTLLSPQATRWVLPSYLRRCITMDHQDSVETEFLIYNLGARPEFHEDTRERTKLLSVDQLKVLLHFVEWCAVHPEWSAYCPDDIASARSLVSTLIADRQRPNKSLERTRER
jgi:hypothetical protein